MYARCIDLKQNDGGSIGESRCCSLITMATTTVVLESFTMSPFLLKVSGSACPSRIQRAGTRSRDDDDPKASWNPRRRATPADSACDPGFSSSWKRPRLQLDSGDEDDIFADPKVTTPGLQKRSIVSLLFANLNLVADAGKDEQNDTLMNNQDQR